MIYNKNVRVFLSRMVDFFILFCILYSKQINIFENRHNTDRIVIRDFSITIYDRSNHIRLIQTEIYGCRHHVELQGNRIFRR